MVTSETTATAAKILAQEIIHIEGMGFSDVTMTNLFYHHTYSVQFKFRLENRLKKAKTELYKEVLVKMLGMIKTESYDSKRIIMELEDYQLTQPERILCAATMFRDTVISGYRHRNCGAIITALTMLSQEKHTVERKDQGFLTSYNRFVDRKEACIIALREGQVKFGPLEEGDELISENLY